MVNVYADKPNPYPIFEKFVKKYGKPDYEGRKMFHIHACWGKCFGDYKRLEFTIKISGMGSKPYPMSLVLTDPVLEKKNRKLFFKNKDSGK